MVRRLMLINQRHEWYVFERDVTVRMRKILLHVMCWINPEWAYPPPASQRYKEFTWENEVQMVLFPDAVEDGNALTQEFLSRLMQQVEQDCMWQDSSNEKQVRNWK